MEEREGVKEAMEERKEGDGRKVEEEGGGEDLEDLEDLEVLEGGAGGEKEVWGREEKLEAG